MLRHIQERKIHIEYVLTNMHTVFLYLRLYLLPGDATGFAVYQMRIIITVLRLVTPTAVDFISLTTVIMP